MKRESIPRGDSTNLVELLLLMVYRKLNFVSAVFLLVVVTPLITISCFFVYNICGGSAVKYQKVHILRMILLVVMRMLN